MKLSWPDVAVLALILGAAVALATMTDWDGAAIVGLVSAVGGIVVGKAVGQGAVSDMAAETSAQTRKIDTIARRVNGELDDRIKQAVDDGNADLIRLLNQEGVLRR